MQELTSASRWVASCSPLRFAYSWILSFILVATKNHILWELIIQPMVYLLLNVFLSILLLYGRLASPGSWAICPRLLSYYSLLLRISSGKQRLSVRISLDLPVISLETINILRKEFQGHKLSGHEKARVISDLHVMLQDMAPGKAGREDCIGFEEC